MASRRSFAILSNDHSQNRQNSRTETPAARRPITSIAALISNYKTTDGFLSGFWTALEKMKEEDTIDVEFYNYYKSIQPGVKNKGPANNPRSTPQGPSNLIIDNSKLMLGRVAVQKKNNEERPNKKNKEVAEELLFRGPRDVSPNGKKPFDELCMFGNDMYLTKDQQDWLEDFCLTAKARNFRRKFYIHKMTNSNVIKGKRKMDIGSNFSKTFLHALLEVEKMVPVESRCQHQSIQYEGKRCQGKNTAMMTTQWANAVTEYKIEENDI